MVIHMGQMDLRTSLLLIEDDINDAVLFREKLIEAAPKEDYHIIHVRSIEEARKFLNVVKFHNIILDLSLLDSKGIETVRAIKSETPDTPIVVLTGVDSDELASSAIQEGAQDYLVKGKGDGHLIKKAIKYLQERQKLENEIFRMACFDEVTGLINGRYFMDRLNRAVMRANRYKSKLSLIYIDIANFRNINERFGHASGNTILKEIASNLKQNMRETDTVARIRSDEFCFIHEQLTDNYKVECDTIINRIKTNLEEETFYLNNIPIKITFNAGVAFYPEVAETAEALLDKADRAMHFARKTKASFHCAVPDKQETKWPDDKSTW